MHIRPAYTLVTRAAVKSPPAPPWASRNRCELRASSMSPQRSSRSSNACALTLLTEKPLARNCPGTDRAEEPYAFVIGQAQRLFEHERQFAMALRASGANVADRSFAFSDDPWQAHTFQADRDEHLWKRRTLARLSKKRSCFVNKDLV